MQNLKKSTMSKTLKYYPSMYCQCHTMKAVIEGEVEMEKLKRCANNRHYEVWRLQVESAQTSKILAVQIDMKTEVIKLCQSST